MEENKPGEVTVASVMQCYQVVLISELSVWLFGREWEQKGEASVNT